MRGGINEVLVIGVPGAGHLEALQYLLAGMGKLGGNVDWWGIYGEMSSGQPRERTGPQQELQRCLPSQVWSSENGVL